MDPSWVLWHSIGTGTTPSGVISPMSPEWNLGAPRPVTARWNSERAQRPRPGASRLCRSLLPRWIYGKNMMQKHTSLKNIHKNTTFDQHVDQHLKHTSEKLAKPKPSFLQLSSPSCCLLWQLVIARTDGITWPQGVLPSTIHSTLQSCSLLLFLLHVASKPSSTIFLCYLSVFFLSLLPPTSNSGAASHPNFSPTAAGGAIWMHLPSCQEASSATGILLKPTAMNSPSIAHFGARPSKHHPSDLSSAQNLSLVGL